MALRKALGRRPLLERFRGQENEEGDTTRTFRNVEKVLWDPYRSEIILETHAEGRVLEGESCDKIVVKGSTPIENIVLNRQDALLPSELNFPMGVTGELFVILEDGRTDIPPLESTLTLFVE